jgi:hypothetical protein
METLQKAWSVLKSPWALFALAVLSALLLAWRLNAGRAADQAELAQLRREKDEATIFTAKIQGALVAKQVEAKDLEARLAAMSPELQAARKRIEDLVGKVRILSVTSGWTAPVAVAGVLGGQAPNLAASQGPGAKPESPPGACPPCLLGMADTAAIQTQDVLLQSEGGARFVVGESWLWRTAPTRERLLGGPWKVEASEAAAEPVPVASSPGWGGGGVAAVGSGGAVAGPTVAFPPVLGSLESSLGAAVNAKGDWLLIGSAWWRFR